MSDEPTQSNRADWTWDVVVELVDTDLLDALVDARLCGLHVGPPLETNCHTFDSRDGRLGAFRTFGRAHFDKTEGRWSVRPKADATAAEQD